MSLSSSWWSGIPASRQVTVCSRQGKATASRSGRLLVRSSVVDFTLSYARSARCVSTDVGAVLTFLANVALPYDYCVPVNRTRIPASSVQPSGCSCYTNFRIQDKGQITSSAMSVWCLHADFSCSQLQLLHGSRSVRHHGVGTDQTESLDRIQLRYWYLEPADPRWLRTGLRLGIRHAAYRLANSQNQYNSSHDNHRNSSAGSYSAWSIQELQEMAHSRCWRRLSEYCQCSRYQLG